MSSRLTTHTYHISLYQDCESALPVYVKSQNNIVPVNLIYLYGRAINPAKNHSFIWSAALDEPEMVLIVETKVESVAP